MSTDHNNALSQQQQNHQVHPRPTLTVIQHPNHPSTVLGTGAVNESLQQQQQQFAAFPATTTQVVLSGGIAQQQTVQQQPQTAQYVVQNVAPVSFVQSK